jgi:hypothetical protein
MKKFKTLREEIANSVGSGAIPGVGVNPPDKPANWGEPGVSKKKQKEIQDNQTSVVMRRKAIFEERRNNISTGDKMPEDTHFDDFISDFGRKPDITHDAGDGKHLIHIFNEKHPDIPGATERTTLFTDRKTGHVNAHIESRVLQSEHNPDEELHSNLFTRGREGGPKGFVAHAYYMLMNGKSGKYAIFNHGGVYANSNGKIKLTNSSRSEGAHAMSLHMRTNPEKFPGIVYNIHDPKTGISREAGEGGYVSTRNMSGPLADYAERQIPQTLISPEHRDPLPEKPLWTNKK